MPLPGWKPKPSDREKLAEMAAQRDELLATVRELAATWRATGDNYSAIQYEHAAAELEAILRIPARATVDVVVDDVHVHETPELLDRLRAGHAARIEPLEAQIATTKDVNAPCGPRCPMCCGRGWLTPDEARAAFDEPYPPFKGADKAEGPRGVDGYAAELDMRRREAARLRHVRRMAKRTR